MAKDYIELRSSETLQAVCQAVSEDSAGVEKVQIRTGPGDMVTVCVYRRDTYREFLFSDVTIYGQPDDTSPR